MTEVSAMFSFSLRGPGPAIMLDAYLVGNALCWLLHKMFSPGKQLLWSRPFWNGESFLAVRGSWLPGFLSQLTLR